MRTKGLFVLELWGAGSCPLLAFLFGVSLSLPGTGVRELCRSGGANGVQRWCRHGHWEAGE